MRIYNPGDRVYYLKNHVGTIVKKLETLSERRDTYLVRFDDGVISDCDEPYLTPEIITPQPPQDKPDQYWVATLVLNFKDGSSIHATHTNVNKDVAWNRLMAEIRTADQSSDVQNWTVTVTRTPICL